MKSEISNHDNSIQIINEDHHVDQEVQAILHADGSEFKTPKKTKTQTLTPEPNEETDFVTASDLTGNVLQGAGRCPTQSIFDFL
jgi:hypothetical protein